MYHKHHIMPRHLGGNNHPDNLVEVTNEEHAKIHHSQWILSGRWQDYIAWQALSGQISCEEATRLASSKTHKGKVPWNKGLKYKIKKRFEWPSRKGIKRKPRTKEHSLAISMALKGKRLGPRGPYRKSICPYCNVVGGSNNMKRWHFDNCRFRNAG